MFKAAIPAGPAWHATSGTAQYSQHEDTLHVALKQPKGHVSCVFDEEEVFIFYDGFDGDVIGFDVPFFRAFWRIRERELIDHLASYLGNHTDCLLRAALYRYAGRTAGQQIYSHAA